jgi:lysophospholipase L1-like esterase
MQQILVYADSVSWGIIPLTRKRLPFDARWPGVMETRLNAQGRSIRVIEDCLNGRRTVWDDPFKPGRNGLAGLAQRIEMHSPLALVILLLGTNDFQSTHCLNAGHAAQGIAALIAEIRRAPIEPGMSVPPVLVVAPPPIRDPKGPVAAKFQDVGTKCLGLAAAYREVANALACPFFDSSTVTSASRIDGVHLDADQHLTLGEALAGVVSPLLLPFNPTSQVSTG